MGVDAVARELLRGPLGCKHGWRRDGQRPQIVRNATHGSLLFCRDDHRRDARSVPYELGLTERQLRERIALALDDDYHGQGVPREGATRFHEAI